MPNLIILSGSDRPNSNAIRVSVFTKSLYKKLGIEPEIVNLADYPFHDVIGGSYDSKIPSVAAFNKKLIEADGIIFVIPEYNGSFPGVLKLAIDYLPFPDGFTHKPVAYIGEAAGAFGSLRAVEQFQLVMNYRNAFSYPERVFIQRISKNFSDDEGPTDPFTSKLLKDQCEGFLAFINSQKASS